MTNNVKFRQWDSIILLSNMMHSFLKWITFRYSSPCPWPLQVLKYL